MTDREHSSPFHVWYNLFHTAFLASLLKDIKSERAKIAEKDNLRLLFVTKWFLQFFLATRSKQKTATTGSSYSRGPWGFGFVGEVVERSWIGWVLKRMRGALEEKVRLNRASGPPFIAFRLSKHRTS